MELGFIGLGKMGMNMVTRLRRDQHRLAVYDRSNELIKQAESQGCIGASSLSDLAGKLSAPRVVWVMVPSGAPTEETIQAVAALLQAVDIIVDGGNTRFHDNVRRAAELKKKGIHYVDAGTSGGIWGLQVGYCLMVGGEDAAVKRLEPAFKTLAPENGWAHALDRFVLDLQNRLNQIDASLAAWIEKSKPNIEREGEIRKLLAAFYNENPDVLDASFVDGKGILRRLNQAST